MLRRWPQTQFIQRAAAERQNVSSRVWSAAEPLNRCVVNFHSRVSGDTSAPIVVPLARHNRRGRLATGGCAALHHPAIRIVPLRGNCGTKTIHHFAGQSHATNTRKTKTLDRRAARVLGGVGFDGGEAGGLVYRRPLPPDVCWAMLPRFSVLRCDEAVVGLPLFRDGSECHGSRPSWKCLYCSNDRQ